MTSCCTPKGTIITHF